MFSSSISTATLAVNPDDAGLAAATFNASQQIGGSLGTALLSTIASSALASYIRGAHSHPTPLLLAHAAVHDDTTAFACAAAILATGAAIAAALCEHGTNALRIDATATPATAHWPHTAVADGARRAGAAAVRAGRGALADKAAHRHQQAERGTKAAPAT